MDDPRQSNESPSIPDISTSKLESIVEGLQYLAKSQRATLIAFERGLPKLREALLVAIRGISLIATFAPRNLLDMEEPPSDEVIAELTSQGFVLMWVPRGDIVEGLCRAPSLKERSEVLLDRRDDALSDCRGVLEMVTAGSLAVHCRLVERAIAASEAGYDEAAQALAANVLDALRATELKADVRRLIRSRDEDGISALGLQGAIVYAALLGVFRSWHPGDPLPETMPFSRHATVHTVEERQYTRFNALMAVLHATSLLRHLQAERDSKVRV